MKKIKCKICDCEFVPELKSHYVSRDLGKTGVVSVFQSNDETQFYDTFDCPQCGCQMVMQERKRTICIGENVQEDEEEITEDVSEGED